MAKEMFWARRPFQYGDVELDRGQILELAGARNDEKLIRLGYIEPLGSKERPVGCRFCHSKFASQRQRDEHGARRHEQNRPMTPEEEDAAQDREERRLDTEAPLNLDKTAASMGASPGA